MTKETLMEMGLTEEQAIRVMASLDGDFVTKARFNEVNTALKAAQNDLKDRNAQLEQLKETGTNAQALQEQLTQLQSELAETKVNAAIKNGLMRENASDIDYLTYKLKEKGETFELDEQGNIKGWADKIAALKTQLPAQFSTSGGIGAGQYEGFRPIEKANKPQSQASGMTRAELLKKPYPERQKCQFILFSGRCDKNVHPESSEGNQTSARTRVEFFVKLLTRLWSNGRP